MTNTIRDELAKAAKRLSEVSDQIWGKLSNDEGRLLQAAWRDLDAALARHEAAKEAEPDDIAEVLENIKAKNKQLSGDLACANTGGLKLLYAIRRELGWNDKTALSIMDTGVRDLRVRAESAEAKNEQIKAVLANLQIAENHYRATRDEFGDGHKYTSQALNDLQREGDIARATGEKP